jgi:large subunit ribosomal protein L4
MPSVDIFDLKNNKVGQTDLADDVFAVEVNQHLLYEAVRHHMAGLRAGTASTKSRRDVAGSGKKLWRQKGTGRARMGSIRSPLWRKGGTTWGPKPRDYSYNLNKKMIVGALRSALSAKLKDGSLKVIKALDLADHKTKAFRSALDTIQATRKALLVDVLGDGSKNIILASRNLSNVTLVSTQYLTTYDLLNHQHVILTEAAASKLSAALSTGEKEAA